MASDWTTLDVVGRMLGARTRTAAAPDFRRALQLVVSGLWLLDGLLQLQAGFFGSSFGRTMIGSMAASNPEFLARPITDSASIIARHPELTNGLFAALQVAIGLAIAWRPALRVGLATSIVWALTVWWIGEGLGGVLTGAADPVSGAPGAALIYAILAVLLWPKDRSPAHVPFEAARATGATAAKLIWLVLWGTQCYFAVAGSNRSSQGLHDLIAGGADGEPAWLAGLDRGAANLVDHRGHVISIALAVALAVIALAVYLPDRAANVGLVAAVAVSMLFWVLGQDFGALFTNAATDVNSGPLLVVLAVAFWRRDADGATRRAMEPGV